MLLLVLFLIDLFYSFNFLILLFVDADVLIFDFYVFQNFTNLLPMHGFKSSFKVIRIKYKTLPLCIILFINILNILQAISQSWIIFQALLYNCGTPLFSTLCVPYYFQYCLHILVFNFTIYSPLHSWCYYIMSSCFSISNFFSVTSCIR